MPTRRYQPFDPASTASALPGPLQQPGGVLLSLLQQFSPGPDALPMPMPLGAAMENDPWIPALGKRISELLDTVFVPTTRNTGLPQRLRLTNWNARAGTLQFHPVTPKAAIGPAPFEATPAQLSTLIDKGALDLQQPGARATAVVRARIRELLDAQMPEYKAEQFKRGVTKPAK